MAKAPKGLYNIKTRVSQADFTCAKIKFSRGVQFQMGETDDFWFLAMVGGSEWIQLTLAAANKIWDNSKKLKKEKAPKIEPEEMADPDCPGCAGGDKWPVLEEVWRCPVCDAEFHDKDRADKGERAKSKAAKAPKAAKSKLRKLSGEEGYGTIDAKVDLSKYAVGPLSLADAKKLAPHMFELAAKDEAFNYGSFNTIKNGTLVLTIHRLSGLPAGKMWTQQMVNGVKKEMALYKSKGAEFLAVPNEEDGEKWVDHVAFVIAKVSGQDQMRETFYLNDGIMRWRHSGPALPSNM